MNKGEVKLVLRNVSNQILTDTVTCKFYNQHLKSERFEKTVPFRGKEINVTGLTAAPEGLYEVFIRPDKYRAKSLFLNIPSNGTAVIDEVFFIDPAQARKSIVLPTFDTIERGRPAQLADFFRRNAIDASRWAKLNPDCQAGFLNLFAKMSAEIVKSRPVSAYIIALERFLPARIHARVEKELLDALLESSASFHVVPGSLHGFPEGWTLIKERGSFKTFDPAGNLQITLAKNASGELLADIDIDDHQGLAHAADVLKHKLSGKDTDPIDIHQTLVFFQRLDPGYSFA